MRGEAPHPNLLFPRRWESGFGWKIDCTVTVISQYGNGAVYTHLLSGKVLPSGITLALPDAHKNGRVVANVHNHPNNDIHPSQDDSLTYSFGGYEGYITDQKDNAGGPF